jgi:division protein 1
MKQWDLETSQCVMTLDVLWATKSRSSSAWASLDVWENTLSNAVADAGGGVYGESVGDFVGSLQFWNFALASGTVDGKIRMWDCK